MVYLWSLGRKAAGPRSADGSTLAAEVEDAEPVLL